MHALDQHCLADLTRMLHDAGLWISRAKVEIHGEEGHTFYLIDPAGGAADKRKVLAACQQTGGRGNSYKAGSTPPNLPAPNPADPARFYFSFLERSWRGSPNMAGSG